MISIEIEVVVLSLVWFDDENWKSKLESIKREWFDNTSLFDKVKSYKEAGYPYDPLLTGKMMGLEEYKLLNEGLTASGGIDLWEHYLLKIRAEYAQKCLSQKAMDGDITAEDCKQAIPLLEKLEKDEREYAFDSDLHDYIADLEKRITKNIEFYTTGIKEIDDTCGMILPGMFFVLSGDSGLGKTTFAVKMFNHFIQSNVPCLFISSEMGYFSLVDKLVSLNTGINAKLIRNGQVSPKQIGEISKSIVEKLAGKQGIIFETGMLNMELIKKKVIQHSAKIVVVDYVQMMNITDLRGMNKADFVEEIAKKLKGLAVDMNCIVIALSQVNKSGEVKSSMGIKEKCDILVNLQLKDDGQMLKKINLIIEKSRYSETKVFSYIMDKTTGNFYREESN